MAGSACLYFSEALIQNYAETGRKAVSLCTGATDHDVDFLPIQMKITLKLCIYYGKSLDHYTKLSKGSQYHKCKCII